MRLAAVFLCWNDWYLLEHAIRNIKPLVEGIIVLAPLYSNYGEKSDIPERYFNNEIEGIDVRSFARINQGNPMDSETWFRNQGLEIARKSKYTHYLMMDADEFYEPTAFLKEKQRLIDNPNLNGLVCGCQVYFRSPSLTCPDITLVPFIHKITPDLKHGINYKYPFAWEGGIKVDPTRQLSYTNGIEWSDIKMHHYSWVRKDYGRKIRNSTARRNLERSTIFQDLLNAKEGYFCKFYQKPLVRAQVDFGIPDYELSDKDLQLMAAASKGSQPLI